MYALMQGEKRGKRPMWPMRLLECELSIVLKSCIRSLVFNQMLHVALPCTWFSHITKGCTNPNIFV